MSLLVWTHIGALVVSTPLLLLQAELNPIPLVYWPVFGALVVLVLVALTSFYKAVQTSPLTIVSPIVSAHLVVVILLSTAFIGERPGIVQVLGITIALVGVALASITRSDSHTGNPSVRKGEVLAITAMLSAGLFVFGIGNLSQQLGWFLPVYIARLGTFGVILPTHLAMHGRSWRGLSAKHAFIAALVGVLQFIGIGAYAIGAQVGPLSVVAASFSVYPIIPVIGGVVVFRERLVSRQAIGVASALAGVVVLGLAV